MCIIAQFNMYFVSVLSEWLKQVNVDLFFPNNCLPTLISLSLTITGRLNQQDKLIMFWQAWCLDYLDSPCLPYLWRYQLHSDNCWTLVWPRIFCEQQYSSWCQPRESCRKVIKWSSAADERRGLHRSGKSYLTWIAYSLILSMLSAFGKNVLTRHQGLYLWKTKLLNIAF